MRKRSFLLIWEAGVGEKTGQTRNNYNFFFGEEDLERIVDLIGLGKCIAMFRETLHANGAYKWLKNCVSLGRSKS